MSEWNGRFQNWNGRQSSILSYHFHTRFCALYLQKSTYRCRVMINNVVTEVFYLISRRIICRQIVVFWLCILRKQCTYCIIVSTLQFAALMLLLTTLTALTFFFEIGNLPSLKFCFLRHENSYLLFHSRFSLIFMFLAF